MSIHKLTAGSGYDYLTRQVAAMDATDKGHTGLASYYTAKGETPGAWVGSGIGTRDEGVAGLEAGDVVTADHLQSLFGSGHHPLAAQRTKELDLRIGRDEAKRPTDADYKTAVRLGTPYKVYDRDISPFRIAVAKQFSEWNEAAGHPVDYPVPAAERARIRTEVAAEFFRVEHGRDPADARELAATIARHSRPKTNAVAGYDLTFSPVKSVSVLWAIADPKTAAVIERAHQAAIKDALNFIESKALFTRRGANGVRQVDVCGLVATAFTHRDSRAGDPDLHTHVAVANKVQTLDGKWLAIDGRPLHKAVVSASETYNTALERHLVDALGVRFEERPNEDARKRPVREIVGVDPELNRRFSKRRINVEDRRKVLAAAFQAIHGRPPTPVETIQLSQQATLETRKAKHEPRSLPEQREAWNREAVEVLGTPQRVKQMMHGALNPTAAARSLADPVVNAAWFTQATERIVATMEGGRSTWQYWHVYAEAQRQVRAANVPTNQVSQVIDRLVSEVLDGRSVSMARSWDTISEPVQLRRADGSSVYAQAGAELFTSSKVLAAEQRLLAAAARHDGYAVEASSVDLALLESTLNGITLNAGQATLVREMATSSARLQLAIAPAGSGKTTAMRALASAWSDGGGTIMGLAPSAAAADALRSQIDTQTDTLAKLTHSLEQARQTGAAMPDWVAGIDSSTLVVIDEAGMADTLSLDAAVAYILERGGSVRLIGDDQQLSAIGAGGVLRDIRATHGALQLTDLVRFKDPAEGAASLALREGKSEALGFYLDQDRVHVGDLATMTEEVFAAWQADRAAGQDSIMLAPTRDLVSELNQRARAHRLAQQHEIDPAGPHQRASSGPVRRLADGNEASIGELIITRENNRRLRTSATDWVKNGDRWTVLAIHDGGDLTVQHTGRAGHDRTVRLPSDYVAKATELGYACTVHTAQGVTADTMHGLASGTESRRQLYTMMTRGAHANHVYLEVVGDGDPHSVIHPTLVRPLTPTDILEQVLARDDAQRSATSLIREETDPATRLGEASQCYLDSLYVAAEDLLRHETTTGVDGTTVNMVDALDTAVETSAPGLSDEAAWPTLRAHVLLLGAAGVNPVEALRAAAGDRELESARDRAAVLDWRLDTSGLRNAGARPLPWMPAIPARLAEDPHWGAYLSQRAHLVEQLAEQVHTRAAEQSDKGGLPVWAQNGIRPAAATVADVEVWRAAMQVPVDDRRPTGASQLEKASATWQRRLNRAVTGDHTPALKEWRQLLYSLAPQVRDDEFTPLLAERLAAMSRAGVTAHELLCTAGADVTEGVERVPQMLAGVDAALLATQPLPVGELDARDVERTFAVLAFGEGKAEAVLDVAVLGECATEGDGGPRPRVGRLVCEFLELGGPGPRLGEVAGACGCFEPLGGEHAGDEAEPYPGEVVERARGVSMSRGSHGCSPAGQVVDRVGGDAERLCRDHSLEPVGEVVVVVAALVGGQQRQPCEGQGGHGGLADALPEGERLFGADAQREVVAGGEVDEAEPLEAVDDGGDRTAFAGPRQGVGVEPPLAVVVPELQGGVPEVPEHVSVVDVLPEVEREVQCVDSRIPASFGDLGHRREHRSQAPCVDRVVACRRGEQVRGSQRRAAVGTEGAHDGRKDAHVQGPGGVDVNHCARGVDEDPVPFGCGADVDLDVAPQGGDVGQHDRVVRDLPSGSEECGGPFRLSAGPRAASGGNGQACPAGREGGQAGGALVRRQRGDVPAAALGPRTDVGERVDQVLVKVVRTVVRGEGTVPHGTVRLPGAAQRVGQGPVGPPSVVVGCSLVDGRADEGVPQCDHVVGLHEKSGVHGGA
jgi:conjugative relaxase-like TrwC/TraI family protein